MTPVTRPHRIGVLGVGNVGSALLGLLRERDGFEVGACLVRDLGRTRTLPAPPPRLTTDPDEVLDGADIVVELMGGVGPAGDLIVRATAAGKRVVSANKAVLAERWSDLRDPLERGLLYFEAAVMAGTPAIGPLSGSLRGSRPLELHAILNGTCNYILGRLEGGVGYAEALAEAQRLGYAEADPSLDVGGVDAAHKLTVLGRLAFDPDLAWSEIRARTHGIDHLTPAIVKEAMEDGGRVRLVASLIPETTPSGRRWGGRVRPVYLPPDHPLAGLASNLNGLVFRGDAVGEVVISGAGAGAATTASAVLGDILAAAAGRPGPALLGRAAPVSDLAPEDLGELLRA